MFRTGNQNLKIHQQKPSWFADLITSLAKFSALLALSYFYLFNSAHARETFEFDLGQKINVLSDKAFRNSSLNEFEAVGNVVITHLKNSIYGERAKVNYTTGDVEVVGNVRYIAPEMTLYGTKLKYNFVSKEIELNNARVLSDSYSITGKKIIQTSPGMIYAEEAEYTTCRDCPESWSIYGKKISITIGQYVRLQHAFIKINGITAMYVPYIIFPIKKKRETGLLFPLIGFSSTEGFQYQQPFFLVIDDHKDLTLTPATLGNRGIGGEFQYRQEYKEKSWLELNNRLVNDRIYEPYKIEKTINKKKDFRYFTDVENHFVYKQYFNSHFYFNDTSDLDTIRDMDDYTREKVRGTEVGGGGFVEGRSSLFSLSAQSYFNKNMLVSDPKKFDKQYVQMMPKITLSSVPYSLVHTDYPLLKNISVGLLSDYTIFKQNKVEATGPIRNARRFNFAPYLDWQLGNIGPVFFSHQLKLDYQNYNLPLQEERNFSKRGLIYETEAKVELEKIYGLSYREERSVPIENTMDQDRTDPVTGSRSTKKNSNEVTTIGVLPEIKSSNVEQTVPVYNNSYRHSQEYKVKHYYLGEQEYRGNKKFKTQIESDDGQFDYLDALRDREHLSNQTTLLDSLPLSNTLEFQWNNSLIKKTSRKIDPYKDNRYLKDNFDYSRTIYFDVSQGLDLTVDSSHMIDRLTRLYVNAGIALDRVTFNFQEFYFHKSDEHKTSASAGFNFERLVLTSGFTFNSFNSTNTPVTKSVTYDASLKLNDLFTLKNALSYNIETKMVAQSSYSVLYAPINNCWKIEVNYTRDLIDKKFGLLLYINYNDSNFTSINVR